MRGGGNGVTRGSGARGIGYVVVVVCLNVSRDCVSALRINYIVDIFRVNVLKRTLQKHNTNTRAKRVC